jgi:hypothetical protein
MLEMKEGRNLLIPVQQRRFCSFKSGQIVSLKIINISVRHLDKWNNAKYFGGTFASYVK